MVKIRRYCDYYDDDKDDTKKRRLTHFVAQRHALDTVTMAAWGQKVVFSISVFVLIQDSEHQ